MNHKQTLVILGSGLMVLSLAAAAGFFLFAPADSAQISKIDGISNTNTYDDFVVSDNSQTASGNINAPSTGLSENTYGKRSLSASSLATQRQRMAFRTTTTPSEQTSNSQNIPGKPTSAQDLQSIMDVQRLAQSVLSAPSSVPVEEFPLRKITSESTSTVRRQQQTPQTSIRPPVQAPQPTVTAKASVSSSKSSAYVKSTPSVRKTTTKTAQKKTFTKPAPHPAEKRSISTGYWIQLASYSTLNRAKGAQDDLKRLGLNTSIEVSNLGAGKLVYRVKAGAWTNEKEAKSFLENFTMNNKDFSDAFVVSSAL